MASGFEIDEDELRKAIAPGLNKIVNQMQETFDTLGEQYKGRPVGEIKSVIQQELARFDASVDSDAELTEYAQAISDGERVEVRVGE